MNDLIELLNDAEAYARKARLSINTVSRKLFGDGTRIRKMRYEGATCNITTLQAARERLEKLNADLESAA